MLKEKKKSKIQKNSERKEKQINQECERWINEKDGVEDDNKKNKMIKKIVYIYNLP